jgi:hypothetical protein
MELTNSPLTDTATASDRSSLPLRAAAAATVLVGAMLAAHVAIGQEPGVGSQKLSLNTYPLALNVFKTLMCERLINSFADDNRAAIVGIGRRPDKITRRERNDGGQKVTTFGNQVSADLCGQITVSEPKPGTKSAKDLSKVSADQFNAVKGKLETAVDEVIGYFYSGAPPELQNREWPDIAMKFDSVVSQYHTDLVKALVRAASGQGDIITGDLPIPAATGPNERVFATEFTSVYADYLLFLRWLNGSAFARR